MGAFSQSPPDGRSSVESLMREYLSLRDKKPGKAYLEAVHRLDRVTGGILVFAKSSKALSRLQEQLRQKLWQKHYLACLEGCILPPQGELKDYLVHEHKRARISEDGKGKMARLTYHSLSANEKCSLVLIRLHTGRYHQIRCQWASQGHPVIGDCKYGASPTSGEGIALCHWQLRFVHPVSKEWVDVQASWPQWAGPSHMLQEASNAFPFLPT